MSQPSGDPVSELNALLASRDPARRPPPQPLDDGPPPEPGVLRAYFGRRVPKEVRAAVSGVLVALMFMLFILIRIFPPGGSGESGLSAVSAKTLPTFWVVRAGQSFSTIAAQTGLTVTQIQDLNPYTDPDTLDVGQSIRLRVTKPGSSGASATAAKVPTSWVVRSGQTFSLIAAKTGLSIPQIAALNPKVNPANLKIGSVLKLSTSG